MDNQLVQIKQMLDFIAASPTAFHAVDYLENMLLNNNYRLLEMNKDWLLESGQKYYLKRNGSFLLAFITGDLTDSEHYFKMISSHTDSPGIKVKPNPEINIKDKYLKLNTEVYGSPIINTWLDRPLSLAGRVVLESEEVFKPEIRLIDFKEPNLIIPNLAIHINKDINKGIELNKQEDILPLQRTINEQFSEKNYLRKEIAEKLKVASEKILDYELFLYETEGTSFLGKDNEFISAGRLDNLAMAWASIKALLDNKQGQNTKMVVLYDNEEVGSSTRQGADSPFVGHILKRIATSYQKSNDAFYKTIENSILISADMAHALHPNFVKKNDLTNFPVLNGGPVIKINANQRYTTDAYSSAIIKQIANKSAIPLQTFVNRSDSKGGSTIGPIAATQLGIKSLDLGNPLLAMHSIRELAGAKDQMLIEKLFNEFLKQS